MKPRTRKTDVLTADLPGGELVLFDRHAERYHQLSPVCAFVWRACDGSTPVDDLRTLVERTFDVSAGEELVAQALRELEHAGLLVDGDGTVSATTPAPIGQNAPRDMDRRDALQRLASRGIAVAMLPVITSLATPSGAAAGVSAAGTISSVSSVSSVSSMSSMSSFGASRRKKKWSWPW
jgi:hypothetical protein